MFNAKIFQIDLQLAAPSCSEKGEFNCHRVLLFTTLWPLAFFAVVAVLERVSRIFVKRHPEATAGLQSAVRVSVMVAALSFFIFWREQRRVQRSIASSSTTVPPAQG